MDCFNFGVEAELIIIIYHMLSFVGADLAYCLIFHKTRLMTVHSIHDHDELYCLDYNIYH